MSSMSEWFLQFIFQSVKKKKKEEKSNSEIKTSKTERPLKIRDSFKINLQKEEEKTTTTKC